MCLSKYIAVYVRTYPDLYCDLRRHVRLCLNIDPNLNLNPAPYPTQNRALFGKSLQ
jgi:hypothetical protein